MQNKKMLAAVFAATITMAMSFQTMAGEWKQDEKGWWWQEEDGSYPSAAWKWLDGNGDGVSECYYFNDIGYLLVNTVTPDHYTVNEDGAWTDEGIVQTKEEQSSMWGDNITVEVKEFAENMYVLDEPRTRAFLIVGDEKALLIDTLFEEDNVLEEVRKITDLPIEVVLTHGHPDHIGGIGYFGSCSINEKDAYLLPGNIEAKNIGEGDIVACGDYCFEVIEIPGHTYGSIALLDRSHKILISGDSVQPGPVVMFGDGVDMNAYADSMKKLMDYGDDIEYIFAGHHDYPVGKEYIQYAYEDATALINGELSGTPMPAMGTVKNLYQGKHVSFLAD